MRSLIRNVVVASAFFLSSQLMAATLISWDFENPSTVGGVSTFAPTTSIGPVTGSASQTGGGPAETFSSVVHLTRFFGTQYPFLTLTVSEDTFLESLTFTHYHNHNPGFPTNPSYDVQLQLDSGAGFVNIGGLLNLSSLNSGGTDTMSVSTVLQPGTHTLRWFPQNLNGGSPDTNTEFFAIDDLTVTGGVLRLVPTSSFWSTALLTLMLLALGSLVLRVRHQAKRH